MRAILLGILLILTPNLYANPPIAVTAWTKKILMNTLTVDYTYKNKAPGETPEGFTVNAWSAIREFLGGYIQVIRDRKLSIHPVFLVEPQVVDSGVVTGIHFWRVNSKVSLPELNIQVVFSLITIATAPSSNTPYVIQSISMIKEENP